MIDHQDLTTRFGKRLQRTEPIDARNVDGDHQIAVTPHRLGVDQQMSTGQRLQRLGKHRRRGKADLDPPTRPLEDERKS
jgi:hypothetical protein